MWFRVKSILVSLISPSYPLRSEEFIELIDLIMSDANSIEEMRAELNTMKGMFEQMMQMMTAGSGNTRKTMSTEQSADTTGHGKAEKESKEEIIIDDDSQTEMHGVSLKKLLEEKRKKMTPIDLLKINQACELKVTDTLKLK